MKHQKLPLIFLTLFTFFLFQNNALIQKTVLESCHLFVTKLLPSLLPMMILSDCFLYFHLPDFLCKYFGKGFQKIFSISSYGTFAFFISCFSGTPANAYIIKNLTEQNYISSEEASKILSFSFFSNPLFLYTMLTCIFKENPHIVLKLLFLPYLVNCMIGIFSKRKYFPLNKKPTENQKDFGTMLSESLKNAMNNLLFILGTVTLFFLLNAFLNPTNNCFLKGILEISQGLNHLITFKGSLKMKELLAITFISFGGLSIHLQIKGILNETSISYKEFFLGRIKQTLISIFIVLLF